MTNCTRCGGTGERLVKTPCYPNGFHLPCAYCTEPLDRKTPAPMALEWDGGSLVNPDTGVAMNLEGETLATFNGACFYNNGVWREEIRLGLIALLQSMKGS